MSGIVGQVGARSGIVGSGTDSTQLEYEQGTWTVALTTSAGATLSTDASSNTASYVRVGNLVSCGGLIICAEAGSSGSLYVSLPFQVTAGTESSGYWAGSCYFQDVTLSTAMWFVSRAAISQSYFSFTASYDGASYLTLQSTKIASGDRIGFGLQYITS